MAGPMGIVVPPVPDVKPWPPGQPAPRKEDDISPPPRVAGERVLVTGAGGFLGGNLVHALCEHGFRVRAVVRRPVAQAPWTRLPDVEMVAADLRDLDTIGPLLDGVDSVIHSAALTRLKPRRERDAYRVNVEGTRVLCHAAARAGARRLVFTSSASTLAAGSEERPATERDEAEPLPIRSPYYATKHLAERLVLEQAPRGLEAIALLPGYILGPRDQRPTTNELLLRCSRLRLGLMPPGGMNVIDVREAALAHVRALWLGEPGQRYILAGPYQRYAHLAHLTQEIIGSRRTIRVLPRWVRPLGSVVLALLNGIFPDLPNGMTVPSYRYSFVSFHLSGKQGDQTFHLHHRPVAQTVFDTLRWFRDSGQAPWLPEHLHMPTQ